MSAALEIQLIALLTAAAAALSGSFLVLRRLALVSDAISHTVLLGIVIGFFLVRDLHSPVLLLAAAATGVLTVFLIELLHRTRLIKEDAAIGIVFPALFALGVILISRYASGVHLDTDVVLLGELAFAPFDRVVIGETDLGPKALWIMGSILLLNLAFISLLYKELKLATFDPQLAALLGFSPALLHYSLMGLVSITAVGAFEAVGSILIVALMIAPPAAAYLLTQRLGAMLVLSAGIGAASAVSGYWVATWLDASIAGAMATMAGVLLTLAFLLAPDQGAIAKTLRRRRQRAAFYGQMLLTHLAEHGGTLPLERLPRPLRAPPALRWAEGQGYLRREGAQLHLTPQGHALAQRALNEGPPSPQSTSPA